MVQAVIDLEEEQLEKLRAQAEARGMTLDELLREAIIEKLGHAPDGRRIPSFIGMGASNYTDTARTAGDMQFEPPPWR